MGIHVDQLKRCHRCNRPMTLMDNNPVRGEWYWVCSSCGVDYKYSEGYVGRENYDVYWDKGMEHIVYVELDNYFYRKYPEYRR